ncbi:MAG: CBS domain-containing protein [Pseudomonadota bacterium]
MTWVKDMMRKKVITIPFDMGVIQICKLLYKRAVSGFPVVNNKEEIVGFISERDIIAAVPKSRFLKLSAKNLMKKNVKTISPEEPISNAFKIFSKVNYRHLPVVRGKKIVGVISRKEVIEHILSGYY